MRVGGGVKSLVGGAKSLVDGGNSLSLDIVDNCFLLGVGSPFDLAGFRVGEEGEDDGPGFVFF